jgi:hypothetical protein
MSRRLIVTGSSRPRELVLVGSLIVGREPTCDISDSVDPLLSRRHAEFTSTATEVTVRDLGSRNGILVNGVKTARAVLRGGDVVQIGHLQVKFVDEVGPFLDLPGGGPAAAQTAHAPSGAEASAAQTALAPSDAGPAAAETALSPSDAATVMVKPPTAAPDDLEVTKKLRP